jgi:acetolactate synthase-1/2/3 large subunit
VLLAGKRLDFTLRFGRPPAFGPRCEFIQIDADQSELQRSQRAVGDRLAMTASAELFAALQELCRMAPAQHASPGVWSDEVRAAVAFRPPEWDRAASGVDGRLHPVQALRPIQALLDSHPDAVLVSDGGEFGQWAQACLAANTRVINGVAGSIGSALPYAIGARLATSAPVVAVLGDGTFGFHAAEIDTAVRYRQPFVAVVGNDARWNAEYQIQLRSYGRDRLVGCELLPTRYDQVCEAFGGYGENVTAASEMVNALARAHRTGRPACINVMIDGLAAPIVRR